MEQTKYKANLNLYRVTISKNMNIVSVDEFYLVDDKTVFNTLLFDSNTIYVNIVAISETVAEYKTKKLLYVRRAA